MGTNSMPCAFATPVMLPGMPAPQLYHQDRFESSRRSCGLPDCPPNPRFGPARRQTFLYYVAKRPAGEAEKTKVLTAENFVFLVAVKCCSFK